MKPIAYIIIAALASLAACDNRKPSSADRKSDSEVNKTSISQHEKLAGEIMDAMKELADTVMTITDLETAKSAATKIDQLGAQFDSIAAQLAPLPPPDERLRSMINARMEARDKEMQRVMGEELGKKMQEIGPEAAAVVQSAFGGFFQKMDKAGKEFERHFKPSEQSGGANRRGSPPEESESKPAGGTP